ncbi:hypothetical protein KUCAC02_035545, partial [Chaenocephalus aceratus]
IQPYSVTENEGFLHLLHMLEPRCHVPNRRFFTEKQTPALYGKTRVFNEAHTGNTLAMLLQEVCREWKTEDKNPALVTDNARNMMLAGVGAQMEPHVRCIAHTLNLASQKALKVEPFPGHVGAFWEQQPAVLNTLLSKKMRRGEAMASLTEDGMTLMPEVITLMSPLKVATTLLSEENPTISMISPIQTTLQRQFQPDER